ncbi:TIGR02117 family protein [Agrobacterium larrymoorei]|uniref:TIGR02117 family protein n=1 Tax=Agrobacterium larrymoorei TaxID=160699 RepID=UPI001573D946|nr:TIGR02117 family protein [Agrobacterium larrymoorei]NTJ43004.1 TIGR02117 family protein [Agrobacterium larrymoorei]
MLVKFFKYLRVALALVFGSLALGTLVPRPLTGKTSDPTVENPRRILVLSNPIHTDIALPVDAELLSRFAFLRQGHLEIDYPGFRYLVFGWGGRAFYTQTPTWSDLKPLPLLKGVTIDNSVMHIALAGDIPLSDTSVTAVDLSDEGYAKLLDFTLASFTRSQGKQIPLIGQSYGRDDAFFEAEGYFNALMGCNTWTAAALRHAGVKTGWWTPLPPLLTASMRLHNSETVIPADVVSPLR